MNFETKFRSRFIFSFRAQISVVFDNFIIKRQRPNRMQKDQAKAAPKIINAKLSNPFTLIKTPVHQSSGLSERIMNITTAKGKQSPVQRRIVSIDLKQERTQTSAIGLSGRKKVLKLRRKTESVDKFQSEEKVAVSLCSSQSRLPKNVGTNLLNPTLKCFESIRSDELSVQQERDKKTSLKSSRENQTNWEEEVQRKKEKLYSQIYKMDKRIFGFQRELDGVELMNDKRVIMDMVKRKTGGEKSENHYGGENHIQIHKNIYKMGKNRIT